VSRSSVRIDQAYFFLLSVGLFILTYIVTCHFARARSWGKDKLVDLLIIIGLIFALIGLMDWSYGIIKGQGLWKTLFNYPVDRNFVAGSYFGNKFLPRVTGLFSDSNLFSYFLFVPTLLAMSLIAIKARSFKRIFYAFAFSVFLITSLLTLSRSGLGMLLVGFFLSALANHRIGGFMAKASLVGLVFAIIIFFNFGFIFEIAEKRLSVENVSSFIGEGRLARFEGGVEAFLSSPLFGVGYGDIALYLPSKISNTGAITSHNFYLDILSASGLIGFFALACGITTYLWRARTLAKDSVISHAAIIGVLGIFAVQIVYRNLINPALAFQIAMVASMCQKKN
jgi:O-antigen ligase